MLLHFFAGSVIKVVWVSMVHGLSVLPSRVACCCMYCRCIFSLVCVFFSVSLFLVLCALVSVKPLFDGIRIVFVIAFFLMKNVLRHDRKKKNPQPGLAEQGLKGVFESKC